MKKRIISITLIVTILFLITSCANPKNKTEVYTFNGEDENIKVNNGLIIVTDDLEKFIVGDLSFKGEELSDVKHYFAKFFFYKDGDENTILNNSSTIEGATQGQRIHSELGSISSEDLFYGKDLELIKESLNFSLSGKLMNGESFKYNLTLNVKDAY
ncbi:MAG TPA: hypothetical protein VFC60_03585 [Tissierellaceae bacterium]|nr:hypothetical protein [Tissierellaceae bacterium]